MKRAKKIFHSYSAKVARFLISGGSAAATNLGVLYLCTDIFNIYYVWSSVIAFAVSFVVSFTMQKFWTFRDQSLLVLNKQLFKYLSVTTINLGINTLLIYTFVEFAHLHYLSAQIIAMVLLAIVSFFIYQFVIFKPSVPVERSATPA